MKARSLLEPHYLFRPSQVGRRLAFELRGKQASRISVRLPWGAELDVNPHEGVGSALARNGVHDMAAAEALWRLTDPGETAVDVGANIGYMTSLLVARVGDSGLVIAFEPHPVVVQTLRRNLAGASAEIREVALSDQTGTAALVMPDDFGMNEGSARLGVAGVGSVEVEVRALDDEVSGPIGCLKLDVEGHEVSVLAGAERLLRDRLIRDIVFEEHGSPPTPTTSLLTDAGYKLFRLRSRLRKLELLPPGTDVGASWQSPNYLATTYPERALARCSAPGWRVLHPR